MNYLSLTLLMCIWTIPKISIPKYCRQFFRLTFLLLIANIEWNSLNGQECSGGEIHSKESFLYGRFEVSMQSARGNGIISSFFLFNKEFGCNWPQENNEVDIEMTGNNELIYFTSHHPGTEHPWFYGDTFEFDFNPHESMQDYAIEWEPGIIRWFVNGELIYTQDEPAAEDIKHPMAIFMNLWASDFIDWVGPWDPSILPRKSTYEAIKYYTFTPGEGNSGTNNNYTLDWEEDFESLDTTIWEVSDFTQLSNSYCGFRSTNVTINDGKLELLLDDSKEAPKLIPVTFSVNTSELELNPADHIYVNGTFNNFCGTCNPMTKQNNLWTLGIELPPGRYEYLYTINGWEDTGGAPQNSECDFLPCDEFLNYGFVLSEERSELVLPSYNWGSCDVSLTTSVQPVISGQERRLLGVYDLMGRPVEAVTNQILLYFYSDGSIEKKFEIDQR